MLCRMMAVVVMLGVCGLVRAADTPEPVDYKKIKDLVPAELVGLKRTECNGQKMKMGEMNMSMVTARFTKDEGSDKAPRVELVIQDYGAMPQVLEGMAAWTAMEMDQEGDEGHHKSCKISGFPALEQYTKASKHAQVMVLVAKRFLLTIQMDNIAPDQIRKTAEALPLAKLAELK